MRQGNLLTGTLILGASAMFVRMIGFLFRIYLSNAMGAEGMGVYMLIVSMYGLCITLATSGMGIAVSKLVAEEFSKGKEANAGKVLRSACGISLAISCVTGAVLFIFAGPIGTHVLKEARTILSLRFLAVGIPFLAVSGCLRGYFVACRRVGNPAAGQVIEQLVKMAFIMSLLGTFLPRGIEYACGVVVLGITVGEVVCFFYSFLGYLRAKKQRPARGGRADLTKVSSKILAITIPVSISAWIRSFLRLAEDVLILSGLKSWYGQDDVATGTYGILKGMVMPLLIFPLSLLSSFVIMLTPEISRLNASASRERLEHAVSRILHITFLAGIMIVAIFMSFSTQLGMVFYKDAQVGEMLAKLSFLCPFMCVEMVVVSILQGIGEQVSSMRYSIMDSLLRVGMILLLIPRSGVEGFVWMVVASNLFTSVLNLIRLLRIVRIRLSLNDWILKPALAAAASTQIVRALFRYFLIDTLPLWAGLAIGIALIVTAYTAVLFSVGSIGMKDVRWILKRLKLSTRTPEPVRETTV